MTTEFKLPELGENVQAGDVINVLVTAGDTITENQPVLELETDKATVEVPSSVSGVIKTVHIKQGDTVKAGQVILTVEEDNASHPAGDGEAQAGQPATGQASEAQSQQEAVAPSQPTTVAQQAEPEIASSSPPPPTSSPPPSPPPSPTTPVTTEIKMPELGENVHSGTIVNVLIAVGDTIDPNQPLLEMETDKATVEVPSSVGGVVKAVHVKAGDTAQVGQTILTVETTTPAAEPAAPASQPTSQPQPEPEGATAVQPPSQKEIPALQVETEEEAAPPHPPAPIGLPEIVIEADATRATVPAAPNVRRLAREIGIEITQVPGTGSGGRVSMADVKNYARRQKLAGGATAPSTGAVPATAPLPDFSRWGSVEREAMSNIRRKTAEHLSQAWATIPHVTQFAKADIGEVEELRKRFSKNVEDAGAKLTITAILLKVVTSVLKSFPQFNASVDMAKYEIVYKKYYHLGVAVDTDRGLLVPVIRDVDRKSILELAVELNQVAEKARNRKLSLEDMQGGTFTITNLGGIGGSYFTPIVNAPEVAILGVARGQMEPVYKNGQFEPRLMLPLALSYDHRLVDGADGARFLRALVEHLEQPFLTALQGW
jgi:pyruvate dehydrogenase E2 component (dihydrolipoamide acetyltransferase)